MMTASAGSGSFRHWARRAYICSEQIYVKRDDKIGLTGCDKSRGCVCRGRQEKCAAGVGGDGDRIGGEWVIDIFTEK